VPSGSNSTLAASRHGVEEKKRPRFPGFFRPKEKEKGGQINSGKVNLTSVFGAASHEKGGRARPELPGKKDQHA